LEGNSPEKRSARTQQKRKLCKPKIKSPLTGTQSKKTRKKMIGTITKQALRHTLHAFVVVPQI
jgi:hypothetical protein